MTRAALLLFALIVAFAAGGFTATRARRALERAALPAARMRPPAVEAALTAWEARGELTPLPPIERDPESAADLAFLRASAAGGDPALYDMARQHAGRDASARALWTLVERARDASTREARRQAFAARWPEAWVLAGPDRDR